jgi:hypothetical protein
MIDLETHRQAVTDYSSYSRSFLNIHDPPIRARVEAPLDLGDFGRTTVAVQFCLFRRHAHYLSLWWENIHTGDGANAGSRRRVGPSVAALQWAAGP